MTNKMFSGDGAWIENACITTSIPGYKEMAYIYGYRDAADFLALHAADINKQDLFIYPILFLYRHHLEILLKQIMYNALWLLDEEVPVIKNKKLHNIHTFWNLVKPLILKIMGSMEQEPVEFSLINALIEEISQYDNNSQAFRYSHSLSGEESLPDLPHINIANASQHMKLASEFLLGVDDGIKNYIAIKNEYLRRE